MDFDNLSSKDLVVLVTSVEQVKISVVNVKKYISELQTCEEILQTFEVFMGR